MRRERLLRGALIGALVVGIGCTETDEALIEEIGVTRLLLLAPELDPQRIADAVANSVASQVATWQITTAVLDLGGSSHDLLFDASCFIIDRASSSPTIAGACIEGLVVGATEEPVPIRLKLTATMEVLRANPKLIGKCFDGTTTTDDCASAADCAAPQTCEFDTDAVPTDGQDPLDNSCTKEGHTDPCDDNCPFVDNPDQLDENSDGIGDACTGTVVVFGVLVQEMDSDGDGFVDSIDNCVWEANADQSQLDPIDDLCEQTADVALAGELNLGPDKLAFAGTDSFVTVEFHVDQLNCDWVALSCTLPESAIELCGHSTSAAALSGC